MAEEQGADYIGVLVEIGFSDRSVSLSEAHAIIASVFAASVVLTFNESPARTAEIIGETQAPVVQLLGHEPPEAIRELAKLTDAEIWKTLYVPIKDSDQKAVSDADILAAMSEYAAAGARRLLLDTAIETASGTRYGGTGQASDWTRCQRIIRHAPIPVFLSGGISPENVAEACATVRPFGVDLCSGVEASRGRRDPDKTRALIDNLRQAIA